MSFHPVTIHYQKLKECFKVGLLEAHQEALLILGERLTIFLLHPWQLCHNVGTNLQGQLPSDWLSRCASTEKVCNLKINAHFSIGETAYEINTYMYD